jgi:ADP-ribose pyrophosphatase
MIQPWKLLKREHVGNFKIFDITVERKVNPRNGYEHDFYVMHPPGWVNVVPVTSAGELVMVEQYRHGSDTIELELPGGVMDPEDDSPVATAVRELREESGYEGRDPKIIGEVFSNPAIMSNKTSTVLIEDCELKHDVELDQGEDLVTKLVPFAEAEEMAHRGLFRHSLVVAAFYHYELYRRRNA